MPSSERKKMLTWLNEQLFLLGVYEMTVDWSSSESEWITTQANDLMAWVAYLSSVRTLSAPTPIEKSGSYSELIFRLPEREFRQAVRVEKAVFVEIAVLISDDEVFHSRSHNSQRPVPIQLAVTLERLGTYGNGGSTGRIARAYGIGTGTVTLYAKRVVSALLHRYDDFVSWPSKQRRQVTSTFCGERYGIDGAVGFVDGTHFNFSQKPVVDGEAYFNRKKRYSINAMIVCDEDKRIIFAFVGWPGSCADSTVFSKSRITVDEANRFSRGQYLVGDSGYQLTGRMLVPYKKPKALLPENAAFNTVVASARVVNENCIGLLKNRWAFLKGMSTQIKEKDDFIWVNKQCMASVMLHNFALAYQDIEPFDDALSDEEEEEDEYVELLVRTETHEGETLRERVKAAVLDD